MWHNTLPLSAGSLPCDPVTARTLLDVLDSGGDEDAKKTIGDEVGLSLGDAGGVT